MTWNSAQLKQLRNLWIKTLPDIPANPSNRYANHPLAAQLGKKLFFDFRFSKKGAVACVSCHKPERFFSDGLHVAVGAAIGKRNTPSIVASAYSPWLFWDGRSDSLWSQALGPLESAAEHAGNRIQYARLIMQDVTYTKLYRKIFGALPNRSLIDHLPVIRGAFLDTQVQHQWRTLTLQQQRDITRVFVNIGKAIAAYVRGLQHKPSRFDHYVAAVLRQQTATANDWLDKDERAGLRLFIGKAMCVMCHNGPLFTNHAFNNVGVPAVKRGGTSAADVGRALGVSQLLKSEFNCLAMYSDAQAQQCAELRFMKTSGVELQGAFKVPSLRNVARTAPYMHAGQFATLEQVVQHYATRPRAPVGYTDLQAVHLNETEIAQIVAFLRSLSNIQD